MSRAALPARPTSQSDLARLNGHRIVVDGIAEPYGKGESSVRADFARFTIGTFAGTPSVMWPESVYGKRVRVEGILHELPRNMDTGMERPFSPVQLKQERFRLFMREYSLSDVTWSVID